MHFHIRRYIEFVPFLHFLAQRGESQIWKAYCIAAPCSFIGYIPLKAEQKKK